MLGRNFLHPTIGDARKVNAILAWAKDLNNRYTLRFTGGAQMITAFCDAAGPSEKGTQGGRLFCLTDSDSHRVSGWIYHESRKVRRVCRSTSTAEVLSACEAYDTAMWLAEIWYELTGDCLPIRIVVDNMGTSKNICTTKLTTEKRLRIDLAIIRQGLRRGDFVITWVPSRANLSDPLTKETLNGADPVSGPCSVMKKPLLDALKTNCTNLKGVNQVTKTKEDVSKY